VILVKYFSEKEAEDFLEKFGFNVVTRKYCSSKKDLFVAISKVGGFPFVMKVSGKKIVHKNKLNGIRLGLNTFSNALQEFDSLKKIKGAKGVMVQKQIPFQKEFLIGIKKTQDFGHVVIFGSGGTNVELKKDVAFRVCPVEKEEIKKMIKDTEISKGLLSEEGKELEKVILKICSLVKKYPNISELDINPLVISEGRAVVLDARILFE